MSNTENTAARTVQLRKRYRELCRKYGVADGRAIFLSNYGDSNETRGVIGESITSFVLGLG